MVNAVGNWSITLNSNGGYFPHGDVRICFPDRCGEIKCISYSLDMSHDIHPPPHTHTHPTILGGALEFRMPVGPFPRYKGNLPG